MIVPVLQSVRVYNNGKEILRTDPGGVPSVYALNNIKIAGGSDFVFVIMGSLGDPYGSYRGQPGIRCLLVLCERARQQSFAHFGLAKLQRQPPGLWLKVARGLRRLSASSFSP